MIDKSRFFTNIQAPRGRLVCCVVSVSIWYMINNIMYPSSLMHMDSRGPFIAKLLHLVHRRAEQD